MSANAIRFLSLENVLKIHADTLAMEGGHPGVRDVGLLQSALAMPSATYGGPYLHDGLAAMAAAYLFHICQNHAFFDGNKRVGAFSAALFLYVNGVAEESLPLPEELETVTLAVASGQTNKAELTEWFRILPVQDSSDSAGV